MSRTLLTAIANQRARIGIIGLGYVGLPLARAFAEAGFRVWGFDKDADKIAQLAKGEAYLKHLGEDSVRRLLAKGFTPSANYDALAEMDAILICVPTPLGKKQTPDLRAVLETGDVIAKHLRKGQLVVLESSTYPGTTSEELAPRLAQSGLQPNRDFYLAYAPEREDPGNKRFAMRDIPKIVGADVPAARAAAKALYGKVVRKVIAVADTRTAEAAKLTENIFRAVNIAMVNELKMVFDKMGLDIWEVIAAARSKPFGYMPFYPGPGLGGHCIPIDPFYLSYKAQQYGVESRFIALAGEINTAQPAYVCARLAAALRARKVKMKGARVLVVGLAYKPDIDDIRESPALALLALLRAKGAQAQYHDPYVRVIPKTRAWGALHGLRSMPLSAERVRRYDALIICTAHTKLDYDLFALHARLVVDTRNAMAGRRMTAQLVKA